MASALTRYSVKDADAEADADADQCKRTFTVSHGICDRDYTGLKWNNINQFW